MPLFSRVSPSCGLRQRKRAGRRRKRLVSSLRSRVNQVPASLRPPLRFETPPGRQLQIDFGERRVTIGDENVRVYLFVATLGYSRRLYVRPFRNERQESWFAGVEGAFRHFGGITEEVLLDNDRGLVARRGRALVRCASGTAAYLCVTCLKRHRLHYFSQH